MLKELQKKRNGQSGFTIIEVLIVLAIAGLILLVVFLAVPALQRNSRNTAMKSDVQSIIGGVSEFQSNNGGASPISFNTNTAGQVQFVNGTNTSETKIQGATNVVPGTVSLPVTAGNAAPAGLNPGDVQLFLGKKCDGTTSKRAVCAVYVNETSNGNKVQFTES